MGDLTLEDLARLVDEQPSRGEREALEANPALRRELRAMRSLAGALGKLPALRSPARDWQRLEEELATLGIIRALPRSRLWVRCLQAAAVIALLVGGMYIGWVTGGGYGPGADMVAATASPATLERARDNVQRAEATEAAAMPLDQARDAVQQAETAWRAAFGRYLQVLYATEGMQPQGDPVARAAGLQLLAHTGEAAVRHAPDDPYVNTFYLWASTAHQQQQAFLAAYDDSWH